MNLNRKRAPGRLSRAIVALALNTGKKLTWLRNSGRLPDAAVVKELECGAEDPEYARLSVHTKITVETERLLIVRRGLSVFQPVVNAQELKGKEQHENQTDIDKLDATRDFDSPGDAPRAQHSRRCRPLA